MRISQRVSALPPYHFAAMARLLAEKRAAGVDVISLTMGDPDLPTPPAVVAALAEAARDPANQRYPDYYGLPALRRDLADSLRRRFGVALDPDREIALMLGSKEGLAHLALVALDPGDTALIPDPGYTTYHMGTLLASGTPVAVPLLAERGWLPDLAAIPTAVARAAKILWLNYPNNPTGATATPQFFAEAVAWAREFDVLLAHDNAYADCYYGATPPPSILATPGASDVAVELHSFSKAYNMAGFRVGFLAGNAAVVGAFGTLKSNIDTGMFQAVQIAARQALTLPPEWMAARNAVYRARRDQLVAACRAAGLTVATPEAGLYLWPRVPAGETAQAFAMRLLDATGVAVTPGGNFGAAGEGFIRVALTAPDERIAEAARRIAAFAAR